MDLLDKRDGKREKKRVVLVTLVMVFFFFFFSISSYRCISIHIVASALEPATSNIAWTFYIIIIFRSHRGLIEGNVSDRRLKWFLNHAG